MKFAYAKRSSLGDPDKESQSFKDEIDEVGLFYIVTFDVEKVPQHISKGHTYFFLIPTSHNLFILSEKIEQYILFHSWSRI